MRKLFAKCGSVNRRLLVSKLFYFFYWSAYGSFFPLLAVYYKQIGMNPSQSGILVGMRPLIEFVSAPSLSSLADRLNIRKVMLIFNLLCWIAFVFPLGMIKPLDKTCHRFIMLAKNITEFTSQETDEVNEFLKSNTPHEPQINPHRKSNVVFSEESIHQIFWVLLFLTVVGEFFASSAPTLADTATLNALGDNKERYGRQRMFGSLGWGSAMFTVGFVIDALPMYKVCDEPISKDYTYAFYFFIVLMSVALIIATKFNFNNADDADETLHGTPRDVLNIFMKPNYFMSVLSALYCGLGMGLSRVFLFWHLEDLGAPPTLFGISSATDHLSETTTYFFIEWLLQKVGHVQILGIGLLVNFVRFFCISYMVNPWFILPLDVLQGFSHAGVWAALTSYLSRAAPKGYRAAVQGILQGFYYGLGRAVGAIGGGVLTHYFGTNIVFRVYGIFSLPILFLFVIVEVIYYRKNNRSILKSISKNNVINNAKHDSKLESHEKSIKEFFNNQFNVKEEVHEHAKDIENIEKSSNDLKTANTEFHDPPLLTSEKVT
ncbi:major facilitator superfamily domain-containing protein 6 [Hydra vulgaris]|uniref:major facilitator superfamily domain-containing protein 6 n=1 Tax=Hydra vulgaris TaxID=6087 RepID=UPI001F5EBE40|nr:major facilitator superfamily domain-containing protein 6 [Hydra vulgaris]